MTTAVHENDYLYGTCYHPQVFSPQECEQIIQMQGYRKASGLWDKNLEQKYIRNSTSTYFPLDEQTRWIYERLQPLVWQVNEGAFHFQLETFSPFQVIEYQPGDFYDWHVDLGYKELSSRKLSLVVFLSDRRKYTGGILKMVSGVKGAEEVPQEQGTLIIFPSYLLHRVEPVITGLRHTLVMWVHGPCFQ